LIDEGELREQAGSHPVLSLSRVKHMAAGQYFTANAQMFRPIFMEWFEVGACALPP